jgi:hypothetical protein
VDDNGSVKLADFALTKEVCFAIRKIGKELFIGWHLR